MGYPKCGGYYDPAVPRTLKLLCVLKVLDKVKEREYVFSIGLITMCPKMGFLGALRVKM